ncbi:hypothetical protein WJX84_011638 [Apatococcus fuscideae]|uniref:Uncharacterized protein n=1 Tax=Apatococcus fuscideae TaxID=2026836 RepID=A0AAW1T1R0_9CHLO
MSTARNAEAEIPWQGDHWTSLDWLAQGTTSKLTDSSTLTTESLWQLGVDLASSRLEAARSRAMAVKAWALQAGGPEVQTVRQQGCQKNCTPVSQQQPLQQLPPELPNAVAPVKWLPSHTCSSRRSSLPTKFERGWVESSSDSPVIDLDCHAVVTPPANRLHAATHRSSSGPLPATQSHTGPPHANLISLADRSDPSAGASFCQLAADQPTAAAIAPFVNPIAEGPQATSHRRTFSPLSATHFEPAVVPRDVQPNLDPPAEVISVLSQLPDCGQVSSGYMRVQQALGKGLTPPQTSPGQESHDSLFNAGNGRADGHRPCTLDNRKAHSRDPSIRPAREASRRNPASYGLDHREPFPWDAQERLIALQEMAVQESLAGSPDHSPSPVSCRRELQLQPSGSGASLISCWDSVGSLEGVQPSPAAVKLQRYGSEITVAKPWNARRASLAQHLPTPQSC